jgi:hypothetical protein
MHDHKKHRDHCCTKEEYDRLVAGVDEFYFGVTPEKPKLTADEKVERLQKVPGSKNNGEARILPHSQ